MTGGSAGGRGATAGFLGLVLCWAAFPALADNGNYGRLGVWLFEAGLELNYKIEDERQTSPFTDRDQRTTTFRPRLDFRTEGWVYHPDLMLFSVGLKPERREEDTDVRRGGADRESTSSSIGYLFDVTFLRSRPYTLQLYASRSRSDHSTSLAPDSVTDSRIARAVLLLRNRFLRTTITIEDQETDTTDFFRFRDASEILRLEMSQQNQVSQTTFRSELVDQERVTQGRNYSVDRSQASFSNRFKFNESGTLTSSFTGLDSSSELFDSKAYTVAETLVFRHGPHLSTRYALRYDGREERRFTSDMRSAAAGLTHQLYENLATSFDIRIDDTDSTSGSIRVDEAILDCRYKRPTSWGTIQVDSGYEFRVEANDIEAVTTVVFNESHVLSGVSQEFLNNFNIDPASIVVTDNTLTFIFQEGIDYLVTVVGNSVAIERTLFGSIGDGQEVVVSYDFTPDGPSEFSRTTLRIGTDVDIRRTLRLFYNLRQSDEDLRSGVRPTRLQSDTQQRVGAELRWKWNRTLVEYEDRDVARAPLTRWRAQESLTFRVSNALSFGGSFSVAETELLEAGDRITDEAAHGDLRFRVSRWGDLEIRALSRRVRGNSQRTDRDGLMARMLLRYGAWRASVRLEYLDEKDDLNGLSRDRGILTLQLERRFR